MQAVIFDCDGVLVDSEVLSARVLRQMAAERGVTLAQSDAFALLHGRKVATWALELQELSGRELPEDFIPEFRKRAAALFVTDLKAVPHVESVIRELDVPFCTASSAPRAKIELTLGMTGLLPWFEGRIFSSYEIQSWKPDPGIFLYAAQQLDVAPQQCVVVEDSLVGVTAARAAGMTVLGYAPHDTADALAAAGAMTFRSMLDLRRLLSDRRDLPPDRLAKSRSLIQYTV